VIDGIDLTPLLTGGQPQAGRILHWLSGDDWAVRKGSWKLSGKGDDAVALVNVERDLAEVDNQLKQQPRLVDGLMTLHRQWIQSVGDR
jgi:hypothetical protein